MWEETQASWQVYTQTQLVQLTNNEIYHYLHTAHSHAFRRNCTFSHVNFAFVVTVTAQNSKSTWEIRCIKQEDNPRHSLHCLPKAWTASIWAGMVIQLYRSSVVYYWNVSHPREIPASNCHIRYCGFMSQPWYFTMCYRLSLIRETRDTCMSNTQCLYDGF